MAKRAPGHESRLSKADLPLVQGRVYHLDLSPAQLSPFILIVGDPARAEAIAQGHFSSIECRAEHRGLVSITGIARRTGQRVSVVTSGMGTPSLEIVVNELCALRTIDFDSRQTNEDSQSPFNIIRIGTSGGLQEDTPLGALVVTEYALGLDNTGLFYEVPCSDPMVELIERESLAALRAQARPGSRLAERIAPYAAASDRALTESLATEARMTGVPTVTGVTASHSGFFANQGRDISSIPLVIPDIDAVLANLRFGPRKLRVENMEMEASFLCHFANGIGGRAGAICVAIANRHTNTFAKNWQESLEAATEAALKTLVAS
jgi:uridine phosphorylase